MTESHLDARLISLLTPAQVDERIFARKYISIDIEELIRRLERNDDGHPTGFTMTAQIRFKLR